MRKIKVASGQFRGFKEVETDATSWVELKAVLDENGIEHEGMKATVRETRNVLEHDNALLPEGDFGLWFSASKVKSGADIDSSDSGILLSLAMSELRRFATAVGIPAGSNPSKSDLAAKIAAYNLGREVCVDSNTGEVSVSTEGIDFSEIEAAMISLGEAVQSTREAANLPVDDEFMAEYKEFIG